MSTNTSIEWTDATWSPLRVRVKENAAAIAEQKGYTSLIQIAGKMAGHVGPHCEHVSPGCEHCYSGTGNARCLPHNGTGLPFDRRSRDMVEPILDNRILQQPMHWKTPKRVFVENQSDLFGEWVPDIDILTMLQMIGKCPLHTFQILTKRPSEALRVLGPRHWRNLGYSPAMRGNHYVAIILGEHQEDDTPFLPNLWMGISVENKAALSRIDILRQIPAALRFISFEPLLEDVGQVNLTGISWAIIGGESGRGARPMDMNWTRNLIRQCRAANCKVFFKQAGRKPYDRWKSIPVRASGSGPDGSTPQECWLKLKDRKGGNLSEWPSEFQVREFPA